MSRTDHTTSGFDSDGYAMHNPVERDSRDEDVQPAKRKKVDKGKRTAAGGESVRKFRGNRGKLAIMLQLPNEIFLEIANYMGPEALLQMSRATRDLREVLMSKSFKPIWRSSWSFSDIPDPPSHFCEPYYAALIFDKFCLGCGEKKATKIDLACHIRFCRVCFKNETTTSMKAMSDELEGAKIGCVLPYYGQLSTYEEPRTFTLWQATREFMNSEFQSILKNYREVMRDPEVSETFLAERLCMSNDRITFKEEISDWLENLARERRRSATKAASERRTTILDKLRGLGYSVHDISITYGDEGRRKWFGLLNQPRPLTDRIWNTIRPQLEEVIRVRRAKRATKKEENKAARLSELADLYTEFRKTVGPNFLPGKILALVPSVAAILSEDDYSHPLTGIFGRWRRILPQLPDIVQRFDLMVVNDYLHAVAGISDPSFRTSDDWAARFEAADHANLNEALEYHIYNVREALSFVDTPQGICSYGMLEAIGWWTPLLPAPRSVRNIANMIVEQLGFPKDVSMESVMARGPAFLCTRCGSLEKMTWISLLDHYKCQQILYENAKAKNQMLGLNVPLYDCHSDSNTSRAAILLTASEKNFGGRYANGAHLGSTFDPPRCCALCKRLDVGTSFSTEADMQAHFRSWHHPFVTFDS